MEIKPLTHEDTRQEIICDSFLVSEIASFQELQSVYFAYEKKHEGKTILLTLDDLDQAEYTSSHASMSHDLDDTDGHDLSHLSPNLFEEGEHKAYLLSTSEFFIRLSNFERKAQTISFADACKKGLTIDDDEVSLLENIHKNPMMFLDNQVILKIVPVEKSYLAMSDFPNGYFTSDLNPFENYAVAKKLCESYRYKLFGIGASLLGFIRDSSLNDTEASLLEMDLAHLYNQTLPSPTIKKMLNLTKEYNYFFLKFVDYLEQ